MTLIELYEEWSGDTSNSYLPSVVKTIEEIVAACVAGKFYTAADLMIDEDWTGPILSNDGDNGTIRSRKDARGTYEEIRAIAAKNGFVVRRARQGRRGLPRKKGET